MVIMYADKVTDSMQRTIDETNRRREKQMAYNSANNIVPTPLRKSKKDIIEQSAVIGKGSAKPYESEEELNIAADPVVAYMNKEQLQKALQKARKDMEKAAKELDFNEAARLRDEMYDLQKRIKEAY